MHDLFAFGDIHGMYNLYETIVNYCKEQDPQCTIVYLGDAADRGPDGYRIIKELLADPQIIYLYGNHEDLFVKAADAIIGHYAMNDELYDYLHNCDKLRAKSIIRGIYNEDVQLHLSNGGESTLIDWICDGANEEIIDQLRNLPRTFSYNQIDFCHAGSTYSSFKAVADAEYDNKPHPTYEERMVIWDRNCIPLGWETDRICIHGHTPTIYLPTRAQGNIQNKENIHPCSWYDMMGAKDKRGGLKIDMDTSAAFTGRSFVLNCNTMKVIGFENPNIRNSDLSNSINTIKEYKLI